VSVLDILLLLLVALGLFFALRAVKRGKTGSCSGDCMSCSKNCKK